MTKIAVIGDIFSTVFFSPYFCRHAISSLAWDETRKHFGENRQGLFHFLMFQLPRTEQSHIGLKSNFPHHDNCTNVWWQMLEEKRGGWVDKGVKDTVVAVVE